MKSNNQRIFEAQKRKEEIARKTKKIGISECGNVKTSFNKCSSEFLEGMGFIKKNSNYRPSKDAWCKKRLDETKIEIDVRKK